MTGESGDGQRGRETGSGRRGRERRRPGLCHLGSDQAQALIARWFPPAADDQLKIACIHHNPVATPPSVSEDLRQHWRRQGKLGSDEVERFATELIGFDGRKRLRAIAEQCRWVSMVGVTGGEHQLDLEQL